MKNSDQCGQVLYWNKMSLKWNPCFFLPILHLFVSCLLLEWNLNEYDVLMISSNFFFCFLVFSFTFRNN
jgi:hypothetical protein